jgi:ribosomal protein S18 acetylase RimI-like enzyme
MQPQHDIFNTTPDDLAFIYELFEHSITYQEQRGFPVWKNYDKTAILRDIDQGHQYKVMSGGIIALVFSVAYRDPVIWRDRDQGQSIYLHRIVVNPAFKGQRLFGRVLDWCKHHMRQRGLTSIRMDTWAANATIIQYYQSFGFERVEDFTTPDTTDLPLHNRNLPLTLLEYRGSPV